jgi:hypothetical protein
MSKPSLLIFFCIVCEIASGQVMTINSDTICLDKFCLGDSISKFGLDIRSFPNNRTSENFYEYFPAVQNPIVLAEIEFKTVLLEFNDSGWLCKLHFFRSARSNLLSTQTRNEYDRAVKYITALMNKNGVRKLNRANTYESYEWRIGNTSLTVYIQDTERMETSGMGVNLTYLN